MDRVWWAVGLRNRLQARKLPGMSDDVREADVERSLWPFLHSERLVHQVDLAHASRANHSGAINRIGMLGTCGGPYKVSPNKVHST